MEQTQPAAALPDLDDPAHPAYWIPPQRPRDLEKWRRGMVLQEYQANPFLIKNRKTDIRAFVFVASVEPLVAYFYRDFMMRVAPKTYAYDDKDKAASMTTYHTMGDHGKQRQEVLNEMQYSPERLADYIDEELKAGDPEKQERTKKSSSSSGGGSWTAWLGGGGTPAAGAASEDGKDERFTGPRGPLKRALQNLVGQPIPRSSSPQVHSSNSTRTSYKYTQDDAISRPGQTIIQGRLLPNMHKLCRAALLAQLDKLDKTPGGFILYGVDLLIDEELSPRLLEFNWSPELSIPAAGDWKLQMNYDMVREIIGIGLKTLEYRVSRADFEEAAVSGRRQEGVGFPYTLRSYTRAAENKMELLIDGEEVEGGMGWMKEGGTAAGGDMRR